MEIHQVLPVIPVSDVPVAVEWYERLLDRPADARPMASLADWAITDSSTLQVFHDPANAGHVAVNLVVEDVDDADAALRRRGIVPEDLVEASAFVRILPVVDPDGNTITLLQMR